MHTRSPGTEAWASRMMRTTMGLAAWTVAWTASVALAAFGPVVFWDEQAFPTVVSIVFSVLVGVGMLIANKRNLQAMDELQRAIQLQTMAWTLGAGLVGGCAWALFARYDLIGFDAEISHLIVFMGLVYLVGSVAGALRYR